MNEIVRPLAHNLGFDSFGQLIASWEERGGICSTMVPDMREKICPICGKGWEVSAKSFLDQTLCQTIDEFCHRICYQGHAALVEAEMWHGLLCDYRPGNPVNNFIPFNWKKIPNEYGGAWNTAWYKVTFLGYVPFLKLGTRKRVYYMGLFDLRQEQIDAFLELVKDVPDTKGSEDNGVYIHAWNREQAKTYLGYFATVVRMDPPKPGSRAAELLADETKRLETKAA